MQEKGPKQQFLQSEQRLQQEASDFLSAQLDVLLEYNPESLEEMYKQSIPAGADLTKVDKALDIAKKSHQKHKRKMTGAPYIIHPLQVGTVANYLIRREIQQGRDVALTEAVIISPLHDTVEDAEDITLAKVIKNEIGQLSGKKVEDGVYALSRMRYQSDGSKHALTEIRYCDQIIDENRKNPDLCLDVAKEADTIVNLLDPLDIAGSFEMKKSFESRESIRTKEAHTQYVYRKRRKLIQTTEQIRIPRLFEQQNRHDLAVFAQTAVDLSKQTLTEYFDVQGLRLRTKD